MQKIKQFVSFLGNFLLFKNSERVARLRENKIFQVVLIVLGFVVIDLYIVFFAFQLGNITTVLDNNDKNYESSQHMLYDINSYESNEDGVLTIKLKNGDNIEYPSSEDYTWVLTRKIKQDTCKLDKEDNLILCGLSDDYGRNILTGSNVYFMWAFFVFLVVLVIFGVRNKMPVLGSKFVVCNLTIIFLLFGLLTVYTLTYF